MKKMWMACVALVLSSLAAAQLNQVVDLSIGMYRLRAEVAASEREREIGLMYRKSMPAQTGMLFVFPTDAVHCFWMKNTLLPLSIAFIDENGKIANMADMKPQTEDAHCPSKPVRYALEMNQGWFEHHGVTAGATVKGLLTPAIR